LEDAVKFRSLKMAVANQNYMYQEFNFENACNHAVQVLFLSLTQKI
jgi:hypothetical protein